MRLEAGERLGEWEVVAPIARGGQGAVLRARHVRTGAAAAIKALIDPTDNAARRFAQEARVLERVAHPNVVRALDRGEVAGGAWLALELIEGEDLLSVVRRGVPPFEATARALGAVALALEHCHHLGVVHRDLKPGNVIVERATGRAVLVDFGLVKRDAAAMHLSSLDGEGEALSLAGELKGTPEYMAPEQVGDRFGEVGPATDVWGLGATLFHLLTGEAPFGRGAAPIVMRKITRQPARDPRAVNPAVPEALAVLCQRCLAKDPAERPRVVDVASALAALAGRRVEAPRPAPPPRLATPTPPSDAAPAPRPRLPARLPAAGETFGGCRIVRSLGRGAFGAVFEAVRPDGSACALKLLHAVDAHDLRARFLREAEAGQAVDHEGVVRVLGHGEERGLLWLAMELVPGARSLDVYVAEEELPLAARVRLLAEIAHAVDAAHRAGLVHRDLKPQNVLVSADGRAKVVDLGLARHLDKERLTMSGAFMGTVHYMAPEQVLGQVTQVGPRSDVWALGVMLHELIAGERPFEGDTLVEVMAAILEDAPANACATAPEAPAALGDVVARALARDPAQRFDTAADLARAAVAALRDRRRRARPAVALGALASVALLVAVGVVATARVREAARRTQLDALAAEAAALVADDAPLSHDLARLRAIREQLARLEADDAALVARARALEGLALLAAGDVAGARAAAADLVHERTPEALALRGGLAAHGDDPLQAAQDLGRALDQGVTRVDLRAWRARALVARGPTPRDAPTVLADVDALERARALTGDEVGLRARALLALGRPDDAAHALAGRDDAPAEVRWRVALTRADALLEGAPGRAREALAGLAAPAPPSLADEATRLAGRAVREVERRGATDDLARVAALAGVVAALAPSAISPEALATLEARTFEFDPALDEARYDLGRSIVVFAPDDPRLLRTVGLLGQNSRNPWRKRELLQALRRALELTPPDRRGEDELFLCSQLGWLVEDDLDNGRPTPDADECLALSTRLLGAVQAPHERATLLWARACARRAKGDLRGALRDLDEAMATVPIDAHGRVRGLVLVDLGRFDEGLDALARYVEVQQEHHRSATFAAERVWDVGRRERRLEHVRRAVAAQVRLAPTSPCWLTRLAWVQRATGDFAAVGPTLARAADALEAEGDRERAARARALAGGAVPGPALDALVDELVDR